VVCKAVPHQLPQVIRKGDVHDLLEFTCQILLEGDMENVFLTGSNARVVPTDTVGRWQ
jgi:urate oxidase